MRDQLNVLIFLALFLFLSLSPVVTQASVRSEYEVKAAFLYNFTRFVTWPALPAGQDKDSLNLCIIGNDPFGDLLNPIRDRKSQGKSLNLLYPDDPLNIVDCQAVFVGESQLRNLPLINELSQKHHILTVSDTPDFVGKGGMIGYVKQGNVIRFEINLTSATAAGLTINSRLLELAVRVIK